MRKKIGIFCAGQAGDAGVITSVFKYREQLWGDADIVFFINEPNSDLLKHNPYVEVRPYAHGEGYPERCLPDSIDNVNAREKGLHPWEDWSILKTADNRLHQENKMLFAGTRDLSDGYFPAPHQLTVEQRHGLEYSNCSKKVFGIPLGADWHPTLFWSDEEKELMDYFYTVLPGERYILFETFAGSGQSKMTDEMVRATMKMCEKEWGDVTFIFVSHKYLNGQDAFPEDIAAKSNVFLAGKFTVRQCGLFADYVELMISVSSGISVATSAWGLNPTAKLQYCGSEVCSTKAIALGSIEIITTDGKPQSQAENEYYEKLNYLLNKYK